MKKKIIAVLLSLSILLLVAAAAEAAAVTKQVSISQVIKLIVNGKTISAGTNGEPVILNGRTLVPIRVVAEALNLKVDWDNKNKTVKITGNTDSDAAKTALAQKDKTIEDLTTQLAQKNNEIQSLKDEIESLKENTDLGDLEDDLISDYDYLENVKIDDINLDGDEDDVTVNIEVNLDSYASKWAKLTDNEIKSWIKSLVNSIQDELSEDTNVTGTITDNDSDDKLVKFSKNGTSSIVVTFTTIDKGYRGNIISDVQDVEDSLDGESFSIGSIQFIVSSVTYNTSNDKINVTLQAKTTNASILWDELTSSQITNGVKAVCKTISDTFEEDADVNPYFVLIHLYDNRQNSLGSYQYNVDSKVLTKI